MKVVKDASISFDDFLRYFFLSEYGVLKSKSGIVPWLKNKNKKDGGYYVTRMASHTDEFMKLLSDKVDEFVNIRNNIGPDGKTNYSLFYMKNTLVLNKTYQYYVSLSTWQRQVQKSSFVS